MAGKANGQRGKDQGPRSNSAVEGKLWDEKDDPGPDTKRGNLRRAEALPFLVQGETVLEVAKRVNVTERTVQRWLREGAFAQRVYEGKLEINAEARRYIAARRLDAVQELWILCQSSTREDQVRVKALELFLKASGLMTPEKEALALPSDEEQLSEEAVIARLLAAVEQLKLKAGIPTNAP